MTTDLTGTVHSGTVNISFGTPGAARLQLLGDEGSTTDGYPRDLLKPQRITHLGLALTWRAGDDSNMNLKTLFTTDPCCYSGPHYLVTVWAHRLAPGGHPTGWLAHLGPYRH